MSFPRPANTPWLVPYLTVHDASAAIAFYRKHHPWSAPLVRAWHRLGG